jgi:hypothetical protein
LHDRRLGGGDGIVGGDECLLGGQNVQVTDRACGELAAAEIEGLSCPFLCLRKCDVMVEFCGLGRERLLGFLQCPQHDGIKTRQFGGVGTSRSLMKPGQRLRHVGKAPAN